MTMGSLIEMYLTAYGWQIYDLFYLTFWMTKIILYPMVRMVFDLFFESVKTPGGFSSPIRDVGLRVVSISLVFILGVLPMVKFDVHATSIKSPGCGEVNIPSESKADLQRKFTGNIYVPLLPYFVMSLGSGVNAVVLNNLPCAEDLLETNKIANGFALSGYGDAEELKAELQDFNQQCYKKARDITNQWVNSSDPKVKSVFRQLSDTYFSSSWLGLVGSSVSENNGYAGSDYFEKVFYSDEAKKGWSPALVWGGSDTWKEMSRALPITVMTTKVSGIHSSCELSDEQKTSSFGCVPCADYWKGKGSKNGLIHRLAKNYIAGVMANMSGVTLEGSSPKIPFTNAIIDPARMNSSGMESYVDEVFNKISEKDVRDIAMKSFEQTQAINAEGLLSRGQGGGLMALFAVNTLTSLGSNIGNMAGTASSLILAKTALKLVYPMLLMMVYAMWIVYMVIAEFKGLALVKGLVMIFVLKLCTSVWAIADRVGSEMMSLLYPNNVGTIDWILSAPDATIVLVATTLFYFAVPSLLMYIVIMAGGPDSSRMAHESRSDSNKTGSATGGAVSAGSSRTIDKAVGGAKSGYKKARGK